MRVKTSSRVVGSRMSMTDFCKVYFLAYAGIMEHGKDWKIVEKVVKTRTGSQVRSHAQKFFIKLNKINKERKKGKNLELI